MHMYMYIYIYIYIYSHSYQLRLGDIYIYIYIYKNLYVCICTMYMENLYQSQRLMSRLALAPSPWGPFNRHPVPRAHGAHS